jgi:hypothetical protein
VNLRKRFAIAALFAATALVTFATVFQYAVWGIYGRPSNPTESLSMVASLVLLVAAVVATRAPRVAARVAIVAVLANWSFFAYAVPVLAEQEAIKQQLEVVFLRWVPGSEPLSQEPLPSNERASTRQRSLQPADMDSLKQAGLSGTISVSGGGTVGEGERSRLFVVMSEQLVSSPVELRQPERTQTIYVQSGSGWRQFPADSRLSRLTVRLEIANHTRLQTWFSVELATGARLGGTAYIWPQRLAIP